ncbi:putative hydroxymethylpyrimidine/phosphomethylpyrimidine kinase 2 [Ophiocordyceps camponoti-floridani]|uniref:Putative hydroxymethylpyrimidine/phosphomethylpyrimidine kinase 2 n=1 Tax=Ophiocordyceps camponoti-floridani TaxID=2030778 RepID=A0A8H4VEZ1_9HYPO|nr:putative hydroxymethylpyrimidine/phosphomethylpyrimidine kinase 2 [Ophiocordyceps camponoti-floridani]
MAPDRVLLVAGSDCSGGAGLEAGQKVLAAHTCYAMTATTALTVQDTTGVDGIHVVPAEFVERQMEACLIDVGADVVVTGMLAAADTVEAVARQLVKHAVPLIVIDPVIVSTSGARLLPDEAVSSLINHLLPLGTIVTPNLPEAQLLVGDSNLDTIRSVADIEALGRRIQGLGPDVSTHGTGCSLAAAISSGLAKGSAVPDAVRAACRYVEVAIRKAPGLGRGHGPLGHFHSTYCLPFSPGYFVEYLLARPDVKPLWHSFIHHPFVLALGDGSLPLESFKGYIVQDYLFLIHFSRAYALAAYKANNMADIESAIQTTTNILHETKLHVQYCASFGISLSEMKATPEHQACTAYTRFVLDLGNAQDRLALNASLAPCIMGYAAAARMLSARKETRREGNPYWEWIRNYDGEDSRRAAGRCAGLLEDEMLLQSPARIEELVGIFLHAIKMEMGFWEMFPSCLSG